VNKDQNGYGTGCEGSNMAESLNYVIESKGLFPDTFYPFTLTHNNNEGKCKIDDGWKWYGQIRKFSVIDLSGSYSTKLSAVWRALTISPLTVSMNVVSEFFFYNEGTFECLGKEIELAKSGNHQL